MKKATYTGTTEFIQGIPPRDLSHEDWEALTDEQRKAAIDSGLYKLAGRVEKTEPKEG